MKTPLRFGGEGLFFAGGEVARIVGGWMFGGEVARRMLCGFGSCCG
ncbi:hypothetical protein [uncultured Alistipes sp.]|nr:hypothetical protein [uncultured Alistipes sp.]